MNNGAGTSLILTRSNGGNVIIGATMSAVSGCVNNGLHNGNVVGSIREITLVLISTMSCKRMVALITSFILLKQESFSVSEVWRVDTFGRCSGRGRCTRIGIGATGRISKVVIMLGITLCVS